MANKQQKNTRHVTYTRYPQQIAAVNTLLSNFSDALSYGYGEESWTSASRIYKRLSGYLNLAERELLATAWRNCYVDQNVEEMQKTVTLVRSTL